jgi:hypothetical protein
MRNHGPKNFYLPVVELKLGSIDVAFLTRSLLALATMMLLACQPARAQTETPLRNTAPIAGPNRPATVPEGYVITPAGYFHSSCVRSLAKGERLLPDGRVQHNDGTVDQEAATCVYPRYSPAGKQIGSGASKESAQTATNSTATTAPVINGYLLDANATTGSATTSYGALIARWTVPSLPTANDGQVLFFFPGFEDIDAVDSILQPVLGWYVNPERWTIASWNCCLNGIVTNSPAVTVSPGDRIYGSITSTCAAGTLSCATWNVLTLDLSTGESTTLADTPSDGQIFNWAFGGVLEVDNIVSCDDFPPNRHLSFDKVTVFDQDLRPVRDIKWTEYVDTPVTPQCAYGGYAIEADDHGHTIRLRY